MKILHTYKVYRPDIDGGIPFVIDTLCRFVDGAANSILVARRFGWGRRSISDGTPVEAVTSFGTLFSTPLAPTFPWRLLRRARSADIVVHHAPFPVVDIALSGLPDHVGLIVFWHADIVGYSWLKQLVSPAVRYALQRAQRIIISDKTALESSMLLKPFAAKCTVIPYGVDVDFWGTLTETEGGAAEMLRQKYPRMILAVGRLVPYKGIDILLRAMQALDATLIIIGEGPQEAPLRKLARQLAVSGKVQFLGRVPSGDMKSFLHAARVLAFPSITNAEAFGIVQLEAMAAGLPIVNTALPTAVPNIARHQQEALTVPPGDPHALAYAISEILDNPDLATRLGKAGRDRARSAYSNSRFLSRMKDVYRETARQP